MVVAHAACSVRPADQPFVQAVTLPNASLGVHDSQPLAFAVSSESQARARRKGHILRSEPVLSLIGHACAVFLAATRVKCKADSCQIVYNDVSSNILPA